LLLNLVRLRYDDPPMFLEVTAVNTSYTLSKNAAISAVFNDADLPNTFSPSAALGHLETPTITYVPLQGEKFTQNLLRPVKLQTLLLLYHTGWAIHRIFEVCLQNMNSLDNARHASGPTPYQPPTSKEFKRAVAILCQHQLKGDICLLAKPREGDDVDLILRFEPPAQKEPGVAEFKKLLGLPPDRNEFTMTTLARDDPTQIFVTTRSLMGSLFYLSQGVEVPASHMASGEVLVTRDAEKRPFDWKQVLGGLFQVRCGHSGRAAVSVTYRGRCFWIAANDIETKATFHMLTQLFALQAGGDVRGGIPVLTVPVGGGR
jgi:hypothetical protein